MPRRRHVRPLLTAFPGPAGRCIVAAMRIRELAPADMPGLAVLLGDADHPDHRLFGAHLHGPPLDGGGRWRRTVVASAGDRVVGAVTAARSRLHPGRLLGAVHVAPDHRRRGLARDLLGRIRKDAGRRPLAGRVRAGDPAGRGLLAALGGRVYRSCPGLRPDPTSEPVRRWCARQAVPPGVRLVPMPVVDHARRVDAWVATYGWTHESWAPVDPAVLREVAPSMLADLEPSYGVLALRDGPVVSAGFWAFPGPDGTVRVTVAVRLGGPAAAWGPASVDARAGPAPPARTAGS